MTDDDLKSPIWTRRTLIQAGLGVGVVAWAGSSLLSHHGGADGRKLAVILLQGGLDGLSLAPPRRDETYRRLRGGLAIARPLPFSADFDLHPAMPELARMARAGQVRLAPAMGTPTRSRSHFQEADVLVTGRAGRTGPDGGWLNRAVAALAPAGAVAAVSLDAAASAAVLGPVGFGAWAPGAPQIAPALADELHDLYRDEPALSALLTSNRQLQGKVAALEGGPPLPSLATRTRALGQLFSQEGGPVAGFLSTGGFDTHRDQGADRGVLADRLGELDQALAALKVGAGEAWARTLVLVVTEFGRTAAANGAGGTDHGVASAALLVGGAVKRGGMIGDWPTLAPARLYEARDLAPTVDCRALFRGVLAEHWGLTRAQLDGVFPQSGRLPILSGLAA